MLTCFNRHSMICSIEFRAVNSPRKSWSTGQPLNSKKFQAIQCSEQLLGPNLLMNGFGV